MKAVQGFLKFSSAGLGFGVYGYVRMVRVRERTFDTFIIPKTQSRDNLMRSIDGPINYRWFQRSTRVSQGPY